MNNERIKHLAEKAGFMLWNNEPWRLDNQCIDWSCDYDNELIEFARLIVKDCALTAGLMEHECRTGIGTQMLDNFGVE